jgi:glycosyltransferase involved in cell wall biosynthesis
MTDLKILKTIGRTYLSSNRIEEALKLYLDILHEYPDDVDSYIIIGDLYLASGDSKSAASLYEKASRLNSNNDIKRRLHLAESESALSPSMPGEPMPTHPDAIARLLQRLAGRFVSVSEEELQKAATLLQEIIKDENPARIVSDHLDEIDALIPALLELNIRQAQADGKPEIAEALQNLLDNIQLQMNAQEDDQQNEYLIEHESENRKTRSKRILLLLDNVKEMSRRAALTAAALASIKCETIFAEQYPTNVTGPFDAVIAFNPHSEPRIMESLAACNAARVPIIVDLDSDFEQMPITHPEYSRLGLGTPQRARAYAAALLLADLITVSSNFMANSLTEGGYTAKVIPDAWSRHNLLWEKTPSRRHTLNIGWIGYPGEVEDVAQIKRVVIRILREFPQTQLVISGDIQVYQLFESLPEPRRLYLPPVAQDDYPYLLGQMDILLVPARNIPYNRSLSDRRLLEAGARSIPWIASPLPGYVEWRDGGFIANTPDEWYSNLRQLVMNKELRLSLGKAGHQRAESRETNQVALYWLDIIEHLRSFNRTLSTTYPHRMEAARKKETYDYTSNT